MWGGKGDSGENVSLGGKRRQHGNVVNPSGATAGAYQPGRHRVAGADGLPGDRQPRGRHGWWGTVETERKNPVFIDRVLNFWWRRSAALQIHHIFTRLQWYKKNRPIVSLVTEKRHYRFRTVVADPLFL